MPRNFDEWKSAADKYAESLLSLEPLWSEDDPYDLSEVAEGAFKKGQTPEAFIREMFEEDLASRAYNDHLVKESLKSNG